MRKTSFADCGNLNMHGKGRYTSKLTVVALMTFVILPEAGGKMDRHVLVPLLEPVVLADVMQVVSPDDDGPLHLHLGHNACARHQHSRCKSHYTASYYHIQQQFQATGSNGITGCISVAIRRHRQSRDLEDHREKNIICSPLQSTIKTTP